MSEQENKYVYAPENAATYDSLGIKDTTYELDFLEVEKMLGDIHGKTWLDFGSGTGRSLQLLKSLGAEKVYGVDHNESMVAEARKKQTSGIEFLSTTDRIPLPDNSMDGAISANVCIEIRAARERELLGTNDSDMQGYRSCGQAERSGGDYVYQSRCVRPRFQEFQL